MKKLLPTDEGSNCLVPKPVLYLKLDKQFSLEQPPIVSYRRGKITQGRFSPRKTFFNHAAIIENL